MKKIILKILLPFFPERKDLEKYWWHKFAQIVSLIAALSSIYTVLWFVSLIFYDFPDSFSHLLYYPAYLPLSFANFLSRFPLYGIIFRELAYVPYVGFILLPFLLVILFYFLPTILYKIILFISQNIHKKKVKIVVVLVSLGVIFFILYLWRFQQVVNEGSRLLDEHCIKVNPLIIDRKNKFIEQYNAMFTQVSQEEFTEYITKYFISAQTYIQEEKKWLAKQKKFIESREFTLLMPENVKDLAGYQFEWYEADYNSSYYLNQMYGEVDLSEQEELRIKNEDERNRGDEAARKYDELIKQSGGEMSWQYYFIQTPITKCPAENNNFPIIPDIFAPTSPVDTVKIKG